MADNCVVASFFDGDEQYGAYIYTPAGVFVTTGENSLTEMAERCEVTVKTAIEGLGRIFDRNAITWTWLGLLADTSPAHVGELLAVIA